MKWQPTTNTLIDWFIIILKVRSACVFLLSVFIWMRLPHSSYMSFICSNADEKLVAALCTPLAGAKEPRRYTFSPALSQSLSHTHAHTHLRGPNLEVMKHEYWHVTQHFLKVYNTDLLGTHQSLIYTQYVLVNFLSKKKKYSYLQMIQYINRLNTCK